MKNVLAVLFLTAAITIAHGQRVQWTSINTLPPYFTNLSVSASAAGANDGAGGSAWLVTGSSLVFVPPVFVPMTITTQQLVWLNKTGGTIYNDSVTLADDITISAASIVRMTRTEVVLQIRGTQVLTNNFNVLRRYVSTRTGVTFTDTALEPGETLSASSTINAAASPDKTGFFSYTLGIPLLTNEFVVRRYSNK